MDATPPATTAALMHPAHVSDKLDANKFISDHNQTRQPARFPSAQGQDTRMLSPMGHGLTHSNIYGIKSL